MPPRLLLTALVRARHCAYRAGAMPGRAAIRASALTVAVAA